VVDTGGVVDEDAEALSARQLDGEHLGAGQGRFDQARNVAPEHSFPFLLCNRHVSKTPINEPDLQKMGAARPSRKRSKCGVGKVAETSEFLAPRHLPFEDDRHRAVVDQLDLHGRPEDARLDHDAELPELRAERF
jgi:hypothetical protein